MIDRTRPNTGAQCGKTSVLVVLCFGCLFRLTGSAENPNRIEAGPLTLEVHTSRTANLFHAVDQIAQWSEFCHKQYVSYFQGLEQGTSEADRDLLAQHSTIRKAHGWGGGLEQTFYTSLDLNAALATGIEAGHLSKDEAETERRILKHFQTRVDQLLAKESPTLKRFERQLEDRTFDLTAFAKNISDFVGGAKLIVPVYLMANPHERNCGGGFNGSRLTLEIARDHDMYSVLLHELFHAFLRQKQDPIDRAASSVAGLDSETLSEGLAYAFQPGLQPGHTGHSDPLLLAVAGFVAKGSPLSDSYTRFNTYGLALRPLLKDALHGKRQSLEAFLPRATDAWLVVAEFEKARDANSKSREHNYRADPTPSLFVFGPLDRKEFHLLHKSCMRHLFQRDHTAAAYDEVLNRHAKPRDAVLLLLSLDDNHRVPETFSDLMPVPWAEIEDSLKTNRAVFRQSKAREMDVFLLAAPSVQDLRSEFRRLLNENRFTLGRSAATK